MTGRLPVAGVSRLNRILPLAASDAIVCLMMICLTLSVIAIAQRLMPGYNGASLLLVAGFLSIEALVSIQVSAQSTILSARSPFQRAAEWVAILAFIKLAVHVPSGFAELPAEIARWQANFLGSFFSTGYLAVVGYGLFIWFLAGVFGQWIGELEHDPDQLDMEREGYGIRDRESIRKNIMGLVFTVGGAMLLMTALLRLDLSAARLALTPAHRSIWYLTVYFILGLALLALTRFASLRSRWYIQKIPIRENLGMRWLVYALLFLLGVGLLAVALPTSYSVSLLNILGILISGLAALVALLELIILTPFLALISLISQLFRGVTPTPAEVPTPQPAAPPPPTPDAVPLPWLEIIKSLLFWGVFLAVLAVSLRHYFTQRSQFFSSLKQIPLFRWLAGIWQSFRLFFAGVSARTAQQVREQLRRFREAPAGRLRSIRRRLNDPRTPREEVLAAYLDLVEKNQGSSLSRRPSDTPNEYSGFLEGHLPDSGSEIKELTGEFIRARYTREEIRTNSGARARELLRLIEQALRSNQEREGKK